MGFAVAGFVVLLRAIRHGLVGLRGVVVLTVLANVLVVTMLPLLFSRDVYSYAFYGRIVAVHDGNPYVQTPVEFGDDDLWPLVGPKWVDTPAVYGPAFTTASSVVARVFETPAAQVDAYRWLAGARGPGDRRRDRGDHAPAPSRPRGLRGRGVRAEPGGVVPRRGERSQRSGGCVLRRGRRAAARARPHARIGGGARRGRARQGDRGRPTRARHRVGRGSIRAGAACSRPPDPRRPRGRDRAGVRRPVPAGGGSVARHGGARRARGVARSLWAGGEDLRVAQLRHARLARPHRVRHGAP